MDSDKKKIDLDTINLTSKKKKRKKKPINAKAFNEKKKYYRLEIEGFKKIGYGKMVENDIKNLLKLQQSVINFKSRHLLSKEQAKSWKELNLEIRRITSQIRGKDTILAQQDILNKMKAKRRSNISAADCQILKTSKRLLKLTLRRKAAILNQCHTDLAEELITQIEAFLESHKYLNNQKNF